MSQQETEAGEPNPVVREVYDRLGELLEQGDDVFVEEGPALLQEAVRQPGFFENVTTDPAPPDEYTRSKVIGDEGEHVIRYMEWPPEYTLMPHEHHGRPCFEVITEGHLVFTDLERKRLEEDRFTFDVIETNVAEPTDTAVIDPRKNEIHSVYSPVRSKSLHVYPDDNWRAYGYVTHDDADVDAYERQEFVLRESE